MDDNEPQPEEDQDLAERIRERGDMLKEGVEDVVENVSETLDETYQRTAEAVADADIPAKAKEIGGKLAEGAKRFRKRTKDRLDALTKGTKKTVDQIREGGERLVKRGPDPERQMAVLKELWDTVLLYDTEKGYNPSQKKGEMACTVLLVGTTAEENVEFMDTFIEYAGTKAEEAALGFGTVRINSDYVIDGDTFTSGQNLKVLLSKGMDKAGVGLILVEDIDLLYRESDEYNNPLFNNRSNLGYFTRIIAKVLDKDEDYNAGNWLLVMTTADRDELPAKIEEILQKELI